MNVSESKASDPAREIDLNADLGEGFPNDAALLALVTSASICCGAHAGDSDVIRRTLQHARDCGVVVGAHPGYADRQGFGRREQQLTAADVRQLIVEQVTALRRLANELGVSVQFLKPHGALYNQAQRQEEVARGVIAATGELNLPLLGQPDTLLASKCGDQAVRYIAEGFPDRRYCEDGWLMPRSHPRAILHAPGEIEAQVLRLVTQWRVATLCIHGDDPRALANAELVRLVLKTRGIMVRSFGDAVA